MIADTPIAPQQASLLLIAAAKARPRYWRAEYEPPMVARLQEGWETCPWLFPAGLGNLEELSWVQNSDVLAVAVVTPGNAYMGPLTFWSSEERMQWQAYDHPEDAYTCHVQEIATFLEPVEVVNHALQSQIKDTHLFPVTSTSFTTLLQKQVESHLGQGSLSDFIAHEQDSRPGSSLSKGLPLCTKAPPVLAALVVTGQLRHVMLLARWPCRHRLFQGFPSETLFTKVPRGLRVPARETTPSQSSSADTVQKLEAVADFLRGLAPHLLANPPAGWMPEVLQEACEEHVTSLGQLIASLDPRTPVVCSTSGVNTLPAQGLIRWMQAASLLKNRSRLKEVVEVAVLETVPLICQEKARQQFKMRRGGVPARETIRRARFIMDAALSMHAREVLLKPAPCLYVGADSSPQGDSNWLLIQLDMFMPKGAKGKLGFLNAWHQLWTSMMHHKPVIHSERDELLFVDDDEDDDDCVASDDAPEIPQQANRMLEQDDGEGKPGHDQAPTLRDIRLRAAVPYLTSTSLVSSTKKNPMKAQLKSLVFLSCKPHKKLPNNYLGCFSCSNNPRSTTNKHTPLPRRWTRVVAEAYQWHCLVPTALGAREAKLSNKVAACLHALNLESLGLEHLQQTMNQVVAFTSDLGVEVGLAEAQLGPSLLQWFDTSKHHNLTVQVEEDTGEGKCLVDPISTTKAEDTPIFENAFPVPGMLHIISNCILQSHKHSMTHWPNYLTQLRAISNFLSKRWEREAIQAHMRRQNATSEEERRFDKDIPTVTHWRWGCVLHLLKAILPLRGVLRSYCQTCDLTNSKSEDVDPDLLREGIVSDFFWAYSRMLLCMHAVLGDVSVWCEGCPCHHEPGLGRRSDVFDFGGVGSEQVDLSTGRGYRQLLGAGLKKVMHNSCPMRGRRSSELAAGDLQQLLKQRISLQSVALQDWLTEPLTADERTLLIHDFAEGLNQIAVILDLKIRFWQQLPWKLCALGHVDPIKAQAAALEVLEACETNPDDPGVQHRVTQAFVGQHSGNLRRELEQFSRGQPLETLPGLTEHIAALVGIPVVERWVERQHSIVKASLGLTRRHPTQA